MVDLPLVEFGIFTNLLCKNNIATKTQLVVIATGRKQLMPAHLITVFVHQNGFPGVSPGKKDPPGIRVRQTSPPVLNVHGVCEHFGILFHKISPRNSPINTRAIHVVRILSVIYQLGYAPIPIPLLYTK